MRIFFIGPGPSIQPQHRYGPEVTYLESTTNKTTIERGLAFGKYRTTLAWTQYCPMRTFYNLSLKIPSFLPDRPQPWFPVCRADSLQLRLTNIEITICRFLQVDLYFFVRLHLLTQHRGYGPITRTSSSTRIFRHPERSKLFPEILLHLTWRLLC